MHIYFNGNCIELQNSQSLLATLKTHDIYTHTPGVAIALNERVISRGEWASTDLQDGDRIEVVYAVQGG